MASLSMLVIFVGLVKAGVFFYEGVQTITVNGVGDPKLMASHVSASLAIFVEYFLFALPGWLLAMVVLLATKFRYKPYYYFLNVISIVLMLGFPFSTLFGVVLGVALYFKRKEFH